MDELSVADFEAAARERLGPGAWAYFAGGAGDEWTLRENVAAFRRWVLRPRVLVDVSEVTTRTTVLGHELSMPLAVAPVAFQKMAHPDGEAALARAAAAVGTAYTLSTLATTSPAQLAASVPEATRWFQLYVFRDQGVTRSLIEQAREAGFAALVLTVDAPYSGRREGPIREGFVVPPEVVVPALQLASESAAVTVESALAPMSAAVTWRDLEWFASVSELPVVVKGIATAEDAALAAEHGVAAVVVSNHGGRQLDGAAAALDVLPEVVEAVAGRLEVLVDGGVRRGADVVKALALGARAVLAGRAPLWGLAADGEAGARRVLELLRVEIELALALVGAASPDAVTRAHVGRA